MTGGALHGTLLHLGTRPLSTPHGELVVQVCQNLMTRGVVLALVRGCVQTPEPLLARVHSSCVTSEAYGSCDCDCAEQLDAALAQIARAGRGVVFYLEQEGRGAGFAAKARDRMLVQASGNRLTTFEAYAKMGLGQDHRQYDEVGFACRLLGITAPLRMLTNNPDKVAALAAQGLTVADTLPLEHPASPFNVDYLAAKSRAGKSLATRAAAPEAAALPEPVPSTEPVALAGAPHLVRLASYLLPVALRDGEGSGPHWFWLHAYFDLAAQRDRIVLTYGRPDGTPPLVRVQRDVLLERFAGRGGGEERRRWEATVRAFVRHGAGAVVMVGTAGPIAVLAESGPLAEAPLDSATLDLLVHHAGAARVRPVVDGPTETGADRSLIHGLASRGLTLETPLLLASP